MKRIFIILISTFLMSSLYADDGLISCFSTDKETSKTYELFRFNSYRLKDNGEAHRVYLDSFDGKKYFLEVFLYDQYNRTFAMRVNEGTFEDYSVIESEFLKTDDFTYIQVVQNSNIFGQGRDKLEVWCINDSI